jgi:hypothetical protein
MQFGLAILENKKNELSLQFAIPNILLFQMNTSLEKLAQPLATAVIILVVLFLFGKFGYFDSFWYADDGDLGSDST